ncbi:MAG: SAM-dependent methyltransferase [Alphaproteobacteria bacterium]
MAVDFHDAHRRHWDDGNRLFEAERWANADHLYGLAAECGLKWLMVKFGMQVESGGDPVEDKDWVHANKVWKRYETYRRGRYGGAEYVLPSVNPFENWNVNQRYDLQGQFDRHRVEPHRQGANVVCNLVRDVEMDGLT